MLCIFACLGLFIDSKIIEIQMLSKERYAKALKIDNNNEMFKYAINTNVGDIVVYGEFKVDTGINDEWLKNDYMYINKITEEYTEHSRRVCEEDSKGNESCHTEYYYEWDEVDYNVNNAYEITFSSIKFHFTDFENYPKYRLELNQNVVNEYKVEQIKDNYIYDIIRPFQSHVGDKRYKYYVVDKNFNATVFGTASDNKFKDGKYLTINTKTLKDFVNNKSSNSIVIRICFWIVYIFICAGCIICYVDLENAYLED